MASEQNGFVLETGNSSMSSLSDSDINPPSSVQKSNHLSDRLDFSHVDGGKMAARMEEKDAGRQEAEKRKLDEGLEDGELSTDSEFEAPRKYQKTDKVNFSASTEVNSSTSFEDESSKTDIETMEMEGEGETTLTESQNFAEEFHIVDDAEIDEDDGNGVNADNVDSDDDLDDNEIYAWLEEGIEKQGTKPVTTGSQEDEEAYTEKEKIILKGISILWKRYYFVFSVMLFKIWKQVLIDF